MKRGDFIRVTMEGTFIREGIEMIEFQPDGAPVGSVAFFPKKNVTVERIEKPQPPVKSVVLDKDGDAWQHRFQGDWYLSSNGMVRSWAELNEHYGPVEIIYRPDTGSV